jgi:sn-glycerol 3-phosphate transport system ATP-binding protein
LRMIAGLEEITSGDIAIAGTVVNKLEPRERGCAMVFQNYALYPHMSVAENIGYALKVAGIKKGPRAEKVAQVAASVGLTEFLDRKPGQLSGGQRQRVAMARAIIREPRVFLFDEPLSNLDAKLRVQMRHEIRRIHNQIRATSVFVTHDQHEGMTLADRIVIMNKGTIDQVGTPEEIYNHPASIYVAGFIGSPAMNFLPGTISVAQRAVLLSGGARLDISAEAALGQDGLLVQVGLRPEQIALARPGQPGLPARFDFVEELGSARLYHFLYEDLSVTVHSEEKHRFTPGQEVILSIPPAAVHLFDAQTTRSLTAVAALAARSSKELLIAR